MFLLSDDPTLMCGDPLELPAIHMTFSWTAWRLSCFSCVSARANCRRRIDRARPPAVHRAVFHVRYRRRPLLHTQPHPDDVAGGSRGAPRGSARDDTATAEAH